MPTSAGSWKKKEFQKNNYFCFIDYAKAFHCVSQHTVENSSRDGNTRPPYLSPEKSVCESRIKLEMDMEQLTGSKLGKEYCILSPCLFNFYAEYIMQNARLGGSITSWNQDAARKINSLKYGDDTALMAESKEELKSLLMRVKE